MFTSVWPFNFPFSNIAFNCMTFILNDKMSFTMRATVVLFQSSYFYCNLKSVKSIIFPLNFPIKLSAIVVLCQSSLHFLCCSTNLTFYVKLLFFTPTYFIHFLSWQSYFTEESLCDWNRYEIKLCFKIFVGAVFLSSSLSLSALFISGYHTILYEGRLYAWTQ